MTASPAHIGCHTREGDEWVCICPLRDGINLCRPPVHCLRRAPNLDKAIEAELQRRANEPKEVAMPFDPNLPAPWEAQYDNPPQTRKLNGSEPFDPDKPGEASHPKKAPKRNISVTSVKRV